MALLCISVIFALIFIILRVIVRGIPALLAKAAASFAFVLLGINNLLFNPGKAGALILIGLVLGMAGDIFLDLKVVYPQHKNIYLNSGMAVFATEHIAVITAVILSFGVKTWHIPVCIAGAALITCAVMCGGKMMRLDFGKFYIKSLLYTILLGTTVTYYIITAATDTVLIPMAIGMILFFVSDVILSVMYFGNKEKENVPIILNHALYYAGQIIFAYMIAFL